MINPCLIHPRLISVVGQWLTSVRPSARPTSTDATPTGAQIRSDANYTRAEQGN